MSVDMLSFQGHQTVIMMYFRVILMLVFCQLVLPCWLGVEGDVRQMSLDLNHDKLKILGNMGRCMKMQILHYMTCKETLLCSPLPF